MSNGSTGQVKSLLDAAQDAMRAGRADEAARLWEQVLAASPDHPQALFRLGQHALMRKETVRARALLERAAHAEPKEPAIPLNLSFVFRTTGDTAAEMAALARALAIDPYFYPALLAKGMLLDRAGAKKQAARVYKDVLQMAPSEDQLAAELRGPMRRAREAVDDNARALNAYLGSRLDAIAARHAGENLGRFEECKDIMFGQKKIYPPQPVMLHFPRLPPLQFYERELFPWLSRLEAAGDLILEELRVVLKEDGAEMRPYIFRPDGVPLNQWAELNRSPRWSAFFLWENGARIDAHCARCPGTAALVESLPLMDVTGFTPNVMFSILAPHTRIPAHCGDTNARLVCHLPLILPPGCRFRVGNETRDWRYGEAWIFDDTIEHEAWNDSDVSRVILILDVWNPYLSAAERELVAALLGGTMDYYRDPM